MGRFRAAGTEPVRQGGPWKLVESWAAIVQGSGWEPVLLLVAREPHGEVPVGGRGDRDAWGILCDGQLVLRTRTQLLKVVNGTAI